MSSSCSSISLSLFASTVALSLSAPRFTACSSTSTVRLKDPMLCWRASKFASIVCTLSKVFSAPRCKCCTTTVVLAHSSRAGLGPRRPGSSMIDSMTVNSSIPDWNRSSDMGTVVATVQVLVWGFPSATVCGLPPVPSRGLPGCPAVAVSGGLILGSTRRTIAGQEYTRPELCSTKPPTVFMAFHIPPVVASTRVIISSCRRSRSSNLSSISLVTVGVASRTCRAWIAIL
mmetsp:Transcript_1954/g.4542  ORF Transcript_1954/g.4542 Transcript_1954/m.4542 type:complete len:230 (-) Transcript_1954:2308-2997(-)